MVSEPVEERTWLFCLHSVQSLIQSGGMRLLQSWKQDPDLGSNSENSLLFSDSACLIRDPNIKHSFWREPMSQGQACFHLTVGFLLSLFLSSASIKNKTVSLWVKQLVISPGPLCEERRRNNNAWSFLKRWIHLEDMESFVSQTFLIPVLSTFWTENSVLCEAVLAP